jgi:hypothetical protein
MKPFIGAELIALVIGCAITLVLFLLDSDPGKERLYAGFILGLLTWAIASISLRLWIAWHKGRIQQNSEPSSWIDRILMGVLVLAMAGAPIQAQQLPSPTGYPGAPSFEYLSYDYVMSVQVSLPTDPQHPQEAGIIAGVICVGIFVAVIGWIGVKIIDAALNVHELHITNNAAQPNVPAESPLPLFDLRPVRYVYSHGPVGAFTTPPPPPPTNGIPSLSNAPPSQCTELIILQTLGGWTLGPLEPGFVPVAPAPLLFEHSFDGTNWTVLSFGLTPGTTVAMPDSGFWRIRPMILSLELVDGVQTLHAPPGALEASRNLKDWELIAQMGHDHDVTAEPGTFYRVKGQ